MKDTVRLIGEIARRLTPERQEVLLEIAEGLSRPSRFFDAMTQDQRRELDEAIAEAERDEGVSSAEVGSRLERLTSRRDV
jgi:hypothetical protein